MKFELVPIFVLVLVTTSHAIIKDWWERANFYQVYPRSFKDSDGDGVGDLNGIASKIPYFKEIGITAIWLSPIFKSPMADFGYDISNYTDIHYEYGTMADFEHLVLICKLFGLKLILDFVPNHTSDEHPWFQKSLLNDSYYRDFYVWHPGKLNETTGKMDPPSNWNSLFRFSAWQWSDIRQEYYLHQCIIKQPDLNYNNPNVVKEMQNVLKFWLKKGVDGFRIDAIPYIFETMYSNGTVPDEPLSGLTNDTTDIDYTTRLYTRDLKETYELVYSWRILMENWKKENGGTTKILMTEAYASLEKMVEYYGSIYGERGSHVPFNFVLLNNITVNSTAQDYKDSIDVWLAKMPKATDYVPNWVVGNHDNHRVQDRWGINRTDIINILVQTLPGIAVTYYGEEIGMVDQWIAFNETVDILALNQGPDNYEKLTRDPARTPFQWDSSRSAGFSTANKTWLPVASNYKTVNVQVEKADPNSHLNIFKRLTTMRKSRAALLDGSLDSLADRNLFIFKREFKGAQLFVVLNFGTQAQTFKLSDYFGVRKGLVVATVTSGNSNIRQGQLFRSNQVITIPKDAGIVLE